MRLAREKALAVAAGPWTWWRVSRADTDGGCRIPWQHREAAAFPTPLRRRRHQVITAVAVRRGDRVLAKESVSAVRIKRLSDAELNDLSGQR